MQQGVEAVVNLLAAWNPLEVPEHVSKDEYCSYAPGLYVAACRGTDLIPSIYEILEGMGIERDSLTAVHLAELKELASAIYETASELENEHRPNNK